MTETSIFMARVAEQTERFDDMVEFLKPVMEEKGATLDSDQRNLLSVAFKNFITTPRAAIRTISAIEGNAKYEKFADALKDYKTKIEEKLQGNCQIVIDLVRKHIIPTATDSSTKCFYYKMIGDYYRYMAESAKDSKLESAKEEAKKAYEEASVDIEKLSACDSIRLGLALNYSVFFYESIGDTKKAVELGEKALSDALDKLDQCSEEEFRDAQNIIELLRENLSLWKDEIGGGAEIADL